MTIILDIVPNDADILFRVFSNERLSISPPLIVTLK